MGRAKDDWIEQQRKEAEVSKLAKIFGIEEYEMDQLDYKIEEDTGGSGEGFYGYIVRFDSNNDPEIMEKIEGLNGDCVSLQPWELYTERDYYDDFYEEELKWQITHSNQLEIFNKQLLSVSMLMNQQRNSDVEFNFLVMIYAGLISSFEYFLSSTFIARAINSNELIGKLISVDADLKNKKYHLNEIHTQKDGVKSIVAKYLSDLSFHNIKKISFLFKNVLSFEFADIDELEGFIQLRHDCVHRAGYDTEGNAINISVESVNNLMEKLQNLAEEIDRHMESLDVQKLQDLL